MIWFRRNRLPGFTIVELLIVIVVIAVLASISVVAYNGIQIRARNAQVAAGADVYHKAVLQYQAVYGSLPILYGCLGANHPNDTCRIQDGSQVLTSEATLDGYLKEFIVSKPTVATKLHDLGLGSDPSYYQRGGMNY